MNNFIKTTRNVVIGTIATGGFIFGLTPPEPQLKVYYGLLHSHSMISDGSGTPEEAFQMAKQNKLDFFALTEHNHKEAESGAGERKDGVLIATNSLLYNGNGNQTVTVKGKRVIIKPLIKSSLDVTSPSFVGIYGQEFSTISSGNHINVLGIDEVITVSNGDTKGLVELLQEIKKSGKPIPILQFNHPDVQSDLFYNGTDSKTISHKFNDYGIDSGDLGPSFKTMVEALDPYVELVEVLSGPALSEVKPNNFHYSPNENDYYFYLKQGFHISPSAGQDNHYKTWGSITDARTGIIAEKLSKDDLFKAIKNHRTFATEDKNLKAIFFSTINLWDLPLMPQKRVS